MRLRRHRQADEATGSGPDEQEQEILRALAALRDTTAREVMTPRVDAVALAAPVTAGDVARAVRESGHSRFPVYEDDLDHLVGILFVKDLFRANWKELFGDGDSVVATGEDPVPQSAADVPIRRLRKPFLVPEGARVLQVLADMRQRRNAFAVVVDEFGGVAGVLTIKDLVSELVGELPDEFDTEEDQQIVRVDADRWLIAGDCPIDEINEALGSAIPEGEYVTLAGFLLQELGHIPEEGESLDYQGWELKVAEMDRRRIAQVVARVPSGTIGDPAGEPANGM